MAVNHVIANGKTLIDLRNDTVTADNMLNGTKAHDKSGNSVTGRVVVQKFYKGTATPSNSIGQDGDLYLKVRG